jgi:enoyl-CoA hydratase/carnithine racemase
LSTALERPARAFVLTGAGDGSFCAGADLGLGDAERAETSDALYALYERMVGSDSVLLAALRGPAIGGGAQLAIASDLRVAGPGAWLRFVGPGHGLAVGAWGLPSLVGRGRAMDLCLTARRVSADAALAMGLVDRVADDPESVALEIATQVAELDSAAVARVKRVIAAAGDPRTALVLEAEGNRGWNGMVGRAAI